MVYLVSKSKKTIFYNLFKYIDLDDVRLISDIYDVHFDFINKLGNKINLLFPFNNKCNISNYNIIDSIIVFDNESLSYLSYKELMILKRHNKLVLFFIDGIDNNYLSIKNAKRLYKKGLFDLVYTYSILDSEKYNLKLNLSYYHKIDLIYSGGTGVTFIGNVKKRFPIIRKILNYFNANNIPNDFYLSGLKNDKINAHKIDYISYEECLKIINKYNVILDIVNSDKDGMSLRYFEAVVYNKKLITNNKNVFNMPYYNRKNIQYFEKIEDIDLEWIIQDNDDISYDYDGSFEPINFIKKIKSDLSI